MSGGMAWILIIHNILNREIISIEILIKYFLWVCRSYLFEGRRKNDIGNDCIDFIIRKDLVLIENIFDIIIEWI